MNDAKYIGLDVHQAPISAVVLDSTGKLVPQQHRFSRRWQIPISHYVILVS